MSEVPPSSLALKREPSRLTGFQFPSMKSSAKLIEQEPEEKKKELLKAPNPKNILIPHKFKPYNFDHWIRTIDANSTIFYYNLLSGETAWLAPCSICYRNSGRWCVQCGTSFCDRHFNKSHFPDGNIPDESNEEEKKPVDISDFTTHEWSINEVSGQVSVEADQEYCIECQVKPATKLCRSCWDAYCTSCFHHVHSVGALKEHKGLNYQKAKKLWYAIRGQNGSAELYINGETDDQTYEKPVELMGPLEKAYFENWKMNQKAAEEYVEAIETLQYELEKCKYEKDKLIMEMNEMAAGFKSKLQFKNAQQSDSTAIFANNESNQSEYRQVLMNPSDRKRGQARTKLIRALLDAPIPGDEEKVEADEKSKNKGLARPKKP